MKIKRGAGEKDMDISGLLAQQSLSSSFLRCWTARISPSNISVSSLFIIFAAKSQKLIPEMSDAAYFPFTYQLLSLSKQSLISYLLLLQSIISFLSTWEGMGARSGVADVAWEDPKSSYRCVFPQKKIWTTDWNGNDGQADQVRRMQQSETRRLPQTSWLWRCSPSSFNFPPFFPSVCEGNHSP